MAYGFACKSCGHQEAHHKIGLRGDGDATKRLPGYRVALDSCGGFGYALTDIPDAIEEYRADPCEFFPKHLVEMAHKLDESDPVAKANSDARMEALHQQGNFRAAWGRYSAYVFQQREMKEEQDFQRALQRASGREDEEKLKKEREKKLKSRNTGGLYIG